MKSLLDGSKKTRLQTPDWKFTLNLFTVVGVFHVGKQNVKCAIELNKQKIIT